MPLLLVFGGHDELIGPTARSLRFANARTPSTYRSEIEVYDEVGHSFPSARTSARPRRARSPTPGAAYSLFCGVRSPRLPAADHARPAVVHVGDVLARLAIGRNAVIRGDRARTGVVRGERRPVGIVAIAIVVEVGASTRRAVDRGVGRPRIDAVPAASGNGELRDADCTCRRDRGRIERRFLQQCRGEKLRRHMTPLRRLNTPRSTAAQSTASIRGFVRITSRATLIRSGERRLASIHSRSPRMSSTCGGICHDSAASCRPLDPRPGNRECQVLGRHEHGRERVSRSRDQSADSPQSFIQGLA